MKHSSKNRLMPRHQALFTKETLFDKIARSVCRAGTLPRKELYEAWETARRVRRRYKGGRVVDLACGHGLLGHIMLILDNTSDHALCIDRKLPDNARKLSQTLLTDWPRLVGKIHFKEMDIEDITIYSHDVVVSAHACGSLTDVIIDKAIMGNARLAVLPCCHNLKTCPTGNLTPWMEPTLAVDAVRAMKLQSRGYDIFTAKIPDTITPKNRLLMGHPRSRDE
ncbi:Methyltransferase domain-containing protein [Desulfocicer vacuolatum DSM 3385]|uniref:Methyltransferase domain-containing protein n=1 Tax=Desulfocicer vacuolatum DSM 3385 TaxID=1121400 RepID=A0A1W2BFP5_9BACT|nr:methyltransferase [Desulfocicer vacuolatum]SMC71676.1 Methyltransferase domain-containing protein [Desulfocicer vacuolatum DSM 3385]